MPQPVLPGSASESGSRCVIFVPLWQARICCVWLSEWSCAADQGVIVAVWSRVCRRLVCSASKQQFNLDGVRLWWQYACAYCEGILGPDHRSPAECESICGAKAMSQSLCGFCVVCGSCRVASWEACWFSCLAVLWGWRACCGGTCDLQEDE